MVASQRLLAFFIFIRVVGAFLYPVTEVNNYGICLPVKEQLQTTFLHARMAIKPSPTFDFRSSVLLAKKDTTNDESKESVGFFSKPANLILFPFILLFGLDLVANIAVITKRSIEVMLYGEYTCVGPWC